MYLITNKKENRLQTESSILSMVLSGEIGNPYVSSIKTVPYKSIWAAKWKALCYSSKVIKPVIKPLDIDNTIGGYFWVIKEKTIYKVYKKRNTFACNLLINGEVCILGLGTFNPKDLQEIIL